MGLNESAGYLAVAGAAFLTGEIAARWGLTPEPFYLGIAVAALGLGLSVLLARDTTEHARLEGRRLERRVREGGERGGERQAPETPSLREVFARASWRDRTLLGCSQAGLVNNLNDGLAWGLFPVFFARAGLSVDQIGILAAAYPATWGLLQVGSGALSDRWGRRRLIVLGMAVQGLALLALPAVSGFGPWLGITGLLGLGTALVYPTLLAAVGDHAPPSWRAGAVGTYRLWRDLGYVAGAIVAGAAAEVVGLPGAIALVGAATLGSGLLAGRLVRDRPPGAESGWSATA